MRRLSWADFEARYGAMIGEAAAAYSLDPAILTGLIKTESNGNPLARSHCGAFGLTQIMPATAKWRGYKLDTPRNQIFSGADYLAYCLRHRNVKGRLEYALAAYNCGPGRCRRRPWPAETRKYIPLVMKYAEQYRRHLAHSVRPPSSAPSKRPRPNTITRQVPKHTGTWKELYRSICKRLTEAK